MPVGEILELKPIDILRADYFLERREMGIFNVGGKGIVTTGDKEYELDYKEALYLGRGSRKVTFRSLDPANPAKFYFCSANAHATYPDHKTTKENAVHMELGTLEESNHRVINRMLVKEVVPTCQLQMGMTELKPGSTWNTMPAHTHNRRMEVYFYFEIPDDQAICHFMGEPQETRHIWMRNGQAVISPEWSIHAACATKNYTFIWAMCGENLDYGDHGRLRDHRAEITGRKTSDQAFPLRYPHHKRKAFLLTFTYLLVTASSHTITEVLQNTIANFHNND